VKWREEAREGPRAIGRILEAGYADRYRTLHPAEPGHTYPPGSPWLRLDYVFASPEIAAHPHACEVVAEGRADRASDHLPVWPAFW
jgi:endonuclease/exonuclease/phosphatase family metal-dependent hydrolase